MLGGGAAVGVAFDAEACEQGDAVLRQLAEAVGRADGYGGDDRSQCVGLAGLVVWLGGGAAANLLGEFGACEGENGPAERGPDDRHDGDGEQVSEVTMAHGQPVDAGTGSEEADGGREQSAGQFPTFQTGQADEMAPMQEQGQRGGVGEDAEVGGDGQTGHPDVVEEQTVDGDGEQGDDGSGDGWGEGVAGGVEGSCVDALRCPEGEGDGKDGEVLGGLHGVGAMEGATAKEIDDGGREGDHPCGGEQGDGEDAGDGSIDGAGEVGEAVLAEEGREEGQGGCSSGLAEDAHGGIEEGFGDGDARDATGVVGGEEAEDPFVGGDERDADHEWERETEPFQKGRMAQVEDAAIAEAFACGTKRGEQTGAEDNADQNSDGERVDAEACGEEDCAEDDTGVVDEWGDGLVEEDLADEEFGADDTADEEEELRGEQEAGERGAEGGVLRGEAVEFITGIDGSEDLCEQYGGAENEDHGIEYDGEGVVATFFVSVGTIAVEDGDERDGGYAADEEVGEHVG